MLLINERWGVGWGNSAHIFLPLVLESLVFSLIRHHYCLTNHQFWQYNLIGHWILLGRFHSLHMWKQTQWRSRIFLGGRGCANSQKCYYFAIFLAENCMKMKEFGPSMKPMHMEGIPKRSRRHSGNSCERYWHSWCSWWHAWWWHCKQKDLGGKRGTHLQIIFIGCNFWKKLA